MSRRSNRRILRHGGELVSGKVMIARTLGKRIEHCRPEALVVSADTVFCSYLVEYLQQSDLLSFGDTMISLQSRLRAIRVLVNRETWRRTG